MENKDTFVCTIEEDILFDESVLAAEKLREMTYGEAIIDVSLEQLGDMDDEIPFTYNGRNCTLTVTENAKIINDHTSEKCYVIFRYYTVAFESKADCVFCDCVWALSEDDSKLFAEYTGRRKDMKIQIFYNMLPSQREYIRKRFLLPVQRREEYNFPIIDQDGLKLLFEVCGKTYSPDVQIQADLLLKELNEYGSSQKNETLKRLSYLLNDGFIKKKIHNISYDKVIGTLDKYVYGMQPLKRIIAERIMLLRRTGKTLSGILIVGNPGVGKSSIGRAISSCYNLPFETIRCEGADLIVLKGLVSTYAGSKPGNPARIFYQRVSKHFVLLFEEIDKMCSVNEKGDPFSIFTTMLGPEKILHDEFVDADVDVSDCIIIATCNDINKIPGYIRDRFSLIITANDLAVSEKVIVGRDYIIPELFKENQIRQDQLIIDNEILELIAKRYCDDHGARKMRYCLDTIICAVVSDWSRGLIPEPFVVTQEFVKQRLDDIMCKKAGIGFAP